MFKSAATKIAHNSTLPGLAGNNELKPLQDLIIAEKTVVNALDRVTTDFARAADALRNWGLGEGEDLGDILSASASLLLHFCTTLTHLSSHTQSIRSQMKSVRTREESLLALHRRHKALQSKCESADKKLSKMNPENKNLQAQMDVINKLREEIKEVEGEILAEEAALGDYKRTEVKEWMGTQFGGIGECGEVAVLIAHYGKLLIESIPLGTTEPGLARAFYSGQDQTRVLTTEADNAIRRVEFSPFPSGNVPSFPSTNASSERYGSPDHRQSIYAPSPLAPPTHPSMLSQSSITPTIPEPNPDASSTDEFGVSSGPSTSQTVSNSSASAYAPSSSSGGRQGGRFATFPIKRRGTGNGENAGVSAKEAEARRSEDSPSVEGLPAYTPLDLSLGGGLQAEPLSLTPASTGNGNQNQSHRREEDDDDDDHVELAYMSPTAESPLPSPMHSRFGAVSEGSNGGTGTDGGLPDPYEAAERDRERDRTSVTPQQERIPTPPSETETDERSLNAAAAREVGRELDALLFSPPVHAPTPARPTGPSAENDSSNINSRKESPPLSPRTLPAPPTINLPSRSASPTNMSTAASTPYRTPPEYPRPSYPGSLPRPNLASLSSSNLPGGASMPSSPLLPPAPGAKVVSAGMFRRQMRSPSGGSVPVADTSPLSFKKRALPTSPYPPRGRAGSAGSGGERAQPQQGAAEGGEEEDQYDYISAYTNDGPEEQKRDGYGQGRFATNLDDGALR
ncbi:hypothetical protein OE88DRAFT_1631130 [Heliocybe sulcata]|uniref:Eisosome component PIL1-domain-containing protein n=1 Tax=Heliocybe sulcata TaxID=5364 RepID=A0A5C3N1H4_9AGAM|nr:hypothetical protein OE88DRAFT_1631130 [Heliocybe sulcata]